MQQSLLNVLLSHTHSPPFPKLLYSLIFFTHMASLIPNLIFLFTNALFVDIPIITYYNVYCLTLTPLSLSIHHPCSIFLLFSLIIFYQRYFNSLIFHSLCHIHSQFGSSLGSLSLPPLLHPSNSSFSHSLTAPLLPISPLHHFASQCSFHHSCHLHSLHFFKPPTYTIALFDIHNIDKDLLKALH